MTSGVLQAKGLARLGTFRQQRIHHYFPSLSPRDPRRFSLSQLPDNVLQLIFENYYSEGYDLEIDLNVPWWNEDGRNWTNRFRSCEIHGHCPSQLAWGIDGDLSELADLRVPPFQLRELGILLLCRSINRVARRVIYAKNDFVIRQSGPGGFDRFMKLNVQDIQSMTGLHIYLDSSHAPSDCRCKCYQCYPSCCSSPLKHVCSLSKDLCQNKTLASWREFCLFLGTHITPGRLRLKLECEVYDQKSERPDFELAHKVLVQLEKLPALASCSVRLTQCCRDFDLRLLAQKAVQKLTIKTSPLFPFTALPTELQYQVLRHTDLVAPQVLMHGLVPLPLPLPCDVVHRWAYEDFSHLQCKANWEAYVRSKNDMSYREEDKLHCFTCDFDPPIASASSGFSTHCRQWHFPHEFFYVSRNFAAMAKEIFWSHNSFLLLTRYDFYQEEIGKYVLEDMANCPSWLASGGHSPSSWKYGLDFKWLQNLCLVFQVPHVPGWQPRMVERTTTLVGIRRIGEECRKGNLNLQALTLRMIFVFQCYSNPRDYMQSLETPFSYPRRACYQIVDSVKPLQRLYDFIVMVINDCQPHQVREDSVHPSIIYRQNTSIESELEERVLAYVQTRRRGNLEAKHKWRKELDSSSIWCSQLYPYN